MLSFARLDSQVDLRLPKFTECFIPPFFGARIFTFAISPRYLKTEAMMKTENRGHNDYISEKKHSLLPKVQDPPLNLEKMILETIREYFLDV